MQIAALLTGRGNNTLTDKNILPVLGKPLLYYPCQAAKKSKYVNDFWVTSDCLNILNAAEEYGYMRILRPKELALPTSLHIDAIDHALEEIIKNKCKPDFLVVMLANSVTIKAEWIDACIEMLLHDSGSTAAVPVYREMDHHPYRAKKINTRGYLEPFFDFTDIYVSTNRQDLLPAYFLCHNFWVLNLNNIDRERGQKPWIFMGDRVKHFEVKEVFDVHTREDLKRSEEWLKTNNIV